jgi:UDP-N-acetylmuramate--alanine ligase
MATIKAAQNYPHRKIYCVFQPHTYTRTITLFNEFTTAFNGVDKLILADIYAAREKDTGIINSKILCDGICKNGVDAVYIGGFDEILSYLRNNLEEGDVLITMGAGDIYTLGETFLSEAL